MTAIVLGEPLPVELVPQKGVAYYCGRCTRAVLIQEASTVCPHCAFLTVDVNDDPDDIAAFDARCDELANDIEQIDWQITELDNELDALHSKRTERERTLQKLRGLVR